jgi:hypothetical protein
MDATRVFDLKKLDIGEPPACFASSNTREAAFAYMMGRQCGSRLLEETPDINLDNISKLMMEVMTWKNSELYKGAYIFGLASVFPPIGLHDPKIGRS